MRISVNLATRPFANVAPLLKRLRIAMGVLALAAIAIGLGLHALDEKAREARQRGEALDARIAHVENERHGYQAMMGEPENAATLAQAENLNRLFDQKAFSWTLAMEDLETVLPGGVQVTTLEPSRDKEGRITLRVRVLGPRDRAVELVENLEHSRRFVRPRIVDESAETAGGPNQRVEPVSASSAVTFDVLADYNPATAEERHAARAGAGAASMTAAKATPAETPLPPGTFRPPYTGAAQKAGPR
ncbi:MAG TPA: fimbrial assembly protein [Terracidiphilus sp.]|nr:fimbrial assembly protein [Terracidiphilus sp.]